MSALEKATKTILLVDDEHIIRKLARSTIESQGYRILEASDGQEALEIAREEKPNLVLLDITMPKMSGFEVCKILKEDTATKDTIIIMVTGDLSEEHKIKGIDSGADDFFVKPFSPIELLNKIRERLEDGGEIVRLDKSPRAMAEMNSLKADPELKGELIHLERGQLLLYANDLGKIYQEELKKASELKMAYQRLKDMEKMKDAFISLVSHELRTPLSIIKGYIGLINEVMKSRHVGSDLHEFMKAITQASEKLESLIQELLDFSKMKSGLIFFEKEEISLPGILELVVNEHMAEAMRKNIDLTLSLKSDFRPLRADRARLREAFGHLVKNAVSFTPSYGKIAVDAVDEGVWVKVKVMDTGKGIPVEDLDNIFSPFYQSMEFLTRDVSGIGLGLTITKHIIEDHGGYIKLESTVGKGTAFTVALPRSYMDAKEIVAELQSRYPQKIDSLSSGIEIAEKELLLYAQEMSTLYNAEKIKNEQLVDTLNELEVTYVQTIAALAQAIDVKDAYKGGHTGRVSFYAKCIATQHNPAILKEKEFVYSLLLHDVGKIGVAEDILGKAGKLSDEEWEKIKSHPEMGARIVGQVKFLSPAISSVRSHHERWDGKGYPDGLKREEIPLSARIISVADAFDAMTSERPYRNRVTKEEAREEIIKNSGVQFDPAVVESFLNAWPEIISYRDDGSDKVLD
ncbi:MAG: response regulator [Candidatus Eremiobacteraeota bacterium]|nr:response regulator [Candidatus Eremiobacteraeota bacterium]